MPTIRIDDEVWAALQKRARPFVDAPNDVLRRELGLASKTGSSEQTAAKGDGSDKLAVGCTPQREYRSPIVGALLELGGSAKADDVLGKVYERVQHKLRPADREKMKSGEPRWRLQARFERKNMEMAGLLKPKSPRGWWELTEKGRTNYK